MERTSQRRELVYCWQCENEWYKDEHGLRCPECESNFVEIVENNDDPRMERDAQDENPFHSHDPWSDPPEADIDDVRSTSRPPNSFIFQSGVFGPNQRSGAGRQSPLARPPPDMSRLFGSMINFMGTPGPGLRSPIRPESQTAEDDNNTFRSRSAPGSRTPSQQAQPGRPRFEIYTNSGPGFTSFRATSSMGGQFPPGGDPQHAPLGEVWQLIDSIMGAHHARQHGDTRGAQPGDEGFAAGPFDNLLYQLMNPGGAPAGDFASSQQAFDQILSHLMEEHQSGNAPGPASAEAIECLPKKAADAEILGNADKADCSICMSEVTKGDIVNVLPCNHWFHPECAKAWLKEHDTCPICRVGIMPKDTDAGGAGGPNSRGGLRVRSPGQAPLHNEDPFMLARRQSGTWNNPIVVPESPTRERRHHHHRHHQHIPTGHRRYSSDPPGARATIRPRPAGQRSPGPGDSRGGGNGGTGGGGITGGLRRIFGGTGGGGGGGNGGGSSTGGGGARR